MKFMSRVIFLKCSSSEHHYSWATFAMQRQEERCPLCLSLFLPMIPAGEASHHLCLPLSLAFLEIQGSQLKRRPSPGQTWWAVRHKVWEHAYQSRNPLQHQLCMSWDHSHFYGQASQFIGICVETIIGWQKKATLRSLHVTCDERMLERCLYPQTILCVFVFLQHMTLLQITTKVLA